MCIRDRWWSEDNKIDRYELITKNPGDTGQLFSSIDIPPAEYISMKGDVLWAVRGNAITNIVTAFETCLCYQTKRAIYIDPSLIEDSEIGFTIKTAIIQPTAVKMHPKSVFSFCR